MRRSIGLVLVMACAGTPTVTTASEPSTTEPPATMTTNQAETTSTQDLRHRTEVWFEGYFVDFIQAYNEFAGDWSAHANDLEFGEARLDCVEGQALIPTWRESVPVAPDPQLEALAGELFSTIEEALELCAGGAIGDFDAAGRGFEEVATIYERISERVSEIDEESG